MSNEWNWPCLICGKPVEIDNPGDDDMGLLPNVVGGTINIDFGYPSRFDDLNIPSREHVTRQAAICDDCFDKKKDLTRRVAILRKETCSFEVISENDGR